MYVLKVFPVLDLVDDLAGPSLDVLGAIVSRDAGGHLVVPDYAKATRQLGRDGRGLEMGLTVVQVRERSVPQDGDLVPSDGFVFVVKRLLDVPEEMGEPFQCLRLL